MEEKILKFAKSHGYDSIKKMPDWQGYTVYEPEYAEVSFTGMPYYIFEKDNALRMSTVKEAFEYMDYLDKEKKS